MQLTLAEAELLADNHKHFQFDGWTLVGYDITRNGFTSTNGAWHTNKWCTKYTFPINEYGQYKVDGNFRRILRTAKI